MTEEEYGQVDKFVLGALAALSGCGSDQQEYPMSVIEKVGVRGSWFHDARHQKFFDALMAVWKEHHTVDAFLIMQRYDGVSGEYAALFDELMESPAQAGQLDYYVAALKQKHVYGAMHRLMTETLKDLNPNDIGIQIETFVRAVHQLQEECWAGDDKLKQLGDYVEASMEKKRRLHEERFVKHNWAYLDGLPWPWKEVDQIFGGLKTGLHILAALASQGKSTMAVDLSVFWNEIGVKHGFFSIDMAADQLADRYPCVMNRVSLAKLNFGGSADDVARFEDGFRKCIRLNNVWLSEMDDAKGIEYQCYRGVKTLGWQAIIIDYIQLVSPDEKGQMPEYTRVQRSVQAVKRIAKRLKVPVVCLAQLSRAFEKDLREKGFAPGLDAIGDSAEIARAAASVTCLYQDEDMRKFWKESPPVRLAYADPSDAAIRYGIIDGRTERDADRESRRKGQESLARQLRPVWFDVKKNQQGRCGKIPFVMFPNYFLFRPGNSDGEKTEETLEGKRKMLPVQMFQQLRDDWTYTEQDWWLEMTNTIPQRGVRLMGETIEQSAERFAAERAMHPEVAHFVDGRKVEARCAEAVADGSVNEEGVGQ